MDSYIVKAGLGDILEKIKAGERLSLDDGARLYRSPDILAVGYLANIVRERFNGDQAFFIYNQHINYSNICTNLCKFCAFGKDKESPLAYEMSVDEVAGKVRERLADVLKCIISQKLVPSLDGKRALVKEVLIMNPSVRAAIPEWRLW